MSGEKVQEKCAQGGMMKILVVDDENMQLKSMRIGLRTEGHSVVTALSAEEAIELVKADSEPFDLIITDYLLTGISGLDLLKTVRAEKQFIPVIMMTAYGRKELVIEAMQNQCNGFIEKPFSLEWLLLEIARVKNHGIQNANYHALNNRFAQTVHQINNPLLAIQGNAQLALLSHYDPVTMKHRMEAIVAATDKIMEINKKILNLGTAREMNINKEKVNIKWLLEDCLNMFEGLMAIKEICLEKVMEESQLHVSGDRFGLQQVFRNLILNAIEAMDGSGHKLLRVTVEMDKTASWISVHIADTGCGVSDAYGKVFFNSGQTTKENGSGMGLRVVKDVVEQHEGHLQISSREGHGTIITVNLPVMDRKRNEIVFGAVASGSEPAPTKTTEHYTRGEGE